MIDIKEIAENHYETFTDRCSNDIDLNNLVWENFSNPMDFYRYCKEDYYDESPYENCFERLYQWDAELFVENPMKCIQDYLGYESSRKYNKVKRILRK